MLKEILVFIPIFLLSCTKPMADNDIATLLNIKEAYIVSEETTKTLDQSIVINEYHLSESSKLEFLQGDKNLPFMKGYESWDKKGWFNSSTDTMNIEAYYFLKLKWDENTQKKQKEIRTALEKENTYFSYYGIRDYHLVQLYVFDTQKNILYELSSGL